MCSDGGEGTRQLRNQGRSPTSKACALSIQLEAITTKGRLSMKNTVSTAVAISLLVASALAQTGRPNFSGRWTLDLAKSDFGPAPAPDSVVMTIYHKEPVVKSTTTQKTPQGETTTESTITTDGKENVNTLRPAGVDQDVKSTSRWDGKTLTTARALEVQGMSISMHDTWDLSADGTLMTVVRHVSTPQGDFSTTMVFNKK